MTRAGAVFVEVLPSMAGWSPAVRTQAAISLKGAGLAAGKGFTGGLMRALKAAPMASTVSAQAKVAADQAALAVESASKKVTAARKREADASGAVRVAELKLAEVRAKESASAASIAAAEERLAKAQRVQAAATDSASAAAAGLARSQEAAAAATKALSTESAVASGRFSGLAASVTGGATRMSSKLGGLAKGVAAMGGLFAGFEVAKFAGQSLKASMEFQRTSNVLVTAAGESVRNLDVIRAGMIDISDTVGTDVTQMNAGMYTIEKAGFRGANGLKILMAAAKGAREENASLGTVTNAMTSIMTSYNIKAGGASKVMNAMATAAGASKTTMEEFAFSLATVLPIAAANHISFAQVAGALGTITAHGTTAFEATQELAFAIRNLAAPNAVAIREMGQLGISSQKVQMNLGKRGVLGTVMDLSSAILKHMGPSGKVLLDTLYKSTSAGAAQKQMFDQLSPAAKKVAGAYSNGSLTLAGFRAALKASTGVDAGQLQQWKTLYTTAHGFNTAIRQGLPGTQTFSEAMKKMMGGSTGLNTALMLLGGNVAPTMKRIAEISKSMGSDKQFNSRWTSTKATDAVQVDIAKTTLSNAGMQAMSALLPGIATGAGALARATVAITNFTKLNWTWLGPLAKGISLVTAALITWSIITKITLWIKALTIWQRIAKAATLGWAVATGVWNAVTGVSNSLLFVRVGVLALDAAAWLRSAAAVVVSTVATKAAAVAMKAWAAAQWLLNVAMDANPIVLVGIAIAALVAGIVIAYKNSATFRVIVQGAFHGIAAAASWMWNGVLKPTFKFIVDAFLNVAGAIIHGAADAFGWVPGIGGMLKNAASNFDHFRDSVNASLDGIHKGISIDVNFKTYGLAVQLSGGTKRPAQPANLSAYISTLTARAAGGPVSAGTLYQVNELGLEMFRPNVSGRILNHAQTAQVLSGRQTSPTHSLAGLRLRLVAGGRDFDGYIEDIADSRVGAANAMAGMNDRAFG